MGAAELGCSQGFMAVARAAAAPPPPGGGSLWDTPVNTMETELDSAFQTYQPVTMLKLGTVADLIVKMMAELLQGQQPVLEDIATVLAAIQDGRDIYRPAEPISVQLRRSGHNEDASLVLVDHLTEATRSSAFRLRRSSSAPLLSDSAPVSCSHGNEGLLLSTPVDSHPLVTDAELSDDQTPLLHKLAAVINMPSPLEAEQQQNLNLSGALRRLSISCLPQSSSSGRVRRWSVEVRAEPSHLLPTSSTASEMDYISCGSLVRCHFSSEPDGIQVLPLDTLERASPVSPMAATLQLSNSSTSKRSTRASNDISSGRLIPVAVMEEVECDLLTAGDWQWDAFQLAASSKGHALSTLGFYLFHQAGLIKQLQLNPVKLARFLRRVEEGYRDNPYHNATHAADVLQSMSMLLHRGGIVPGFVASQSLTLMACYLAAIVHDLEHPGVTNDFLISTGDTLALRYNDQRPLENHHVAVAFSLLARPEYNFMESLSKTQHASVRKVAIDLVLATDMKSHYSILGQFNAQFNSTASSAYKHCQSCQTECMPDAGCGSNRRGQAVADPKSDLQLILALQMAIKCSDLGHTAASLPVHCKWVECLQEEMCRQGDMELARGVTVSFSRADTIRMQRGQPAFFDIVVIPMLKAFSQAFPASTPLLNHALANRNHWTSACCQ